MLNDKDPVATVAVKNLAAARKFYEGILGLKVASTEEPEVIVFKSGRSLINVYRSTFAGTNLATAVTWAVGEELTSLVRDLKTKGVQFEHYDIPGLRLEGDLHVRDEDDMRVAWFKDPDGNILNLINR